MLHIVNLHLLIHHLHIDRQEHIFDFLIDILQFVLLGMVYLVENHNKFYNKLPQQRIPILMKKRNKKLKTKFLVFQFFELRDDGDIIIGNAFRKIDSFYNLLYLVHSNSIHALIVIRQQ